MKLPATLLSIDTKFRALLGRISLGCEAGNLCTKDGYSNLRGVTVLSSADVAANVTTDAQAVTTRMTVFSGRTAATAATIPDATGSLRELFIMNTNTSSGAVTLTSPATNMFSAANASAVATCVVAINTTVRLLSNGTNWYRVATST